ncbi:hypothetical protein EXIGLDRAFT_740955 [Exidia glandulosa HHB12029]|uniref:NAD(P)-binding domain-containing protein n=1 Tax=Exidia glandulosa HHB12029 TaxID=1314781 RepID=A0A165FUI6_EXIGL|nr:hypothetical protein EXIGLDRAFT_740955 [Exidia glandulosa HHB12029]
MTSTERSALIVGATGQVGRHLLRELLASPTYTRVAEYGRRVTPLDDLPAEHHAKLVQKTVDFENLDEAAWKEGNFSAVYITLGTTRATAGSAAAFEKIDREFVVKSAKAAKVNGTPQTLVYLSSAGANASSFFLYPKSKGLTENALAALGYSDTIVFRPGLLTETKRAEPRMAETITEAATGFLNRLTPIFQMPVPILAKSMLKAGALGSAKLPAEAAATKTGPTETPFTLIDNKGTLGLAQSS